MKHIAISLFFLGSSLAVAAGEVEAFLMAYGSMDKSGFQVITDYRTEIHTKCSRDVTVDELKVFSNSPLYMKLLTLGRAGASTTLEYQTALTTVSCK